MLLTVTLFLESHTTCLLYDFLLLIVRQMASCLAMRGVLLLHIQYYTATGNCKYPWPRNKLTEWHWLGYAEWDVIYIMLEVYIYNVKILRIRMGI